MVVQQPEPDVVMENIKIHQLQVVKPIHVQIVHLDGFHLVVSTLANNVQLQQNQMTKNHYAYQWNAMVANM